MGETRVGAGAVVQREAGREEKLWMLISDVVKGHETPLPENRNPTGNT